MEHTFLREVRVFFVFGSRNGKVLGYLKVAAEVGGEPASVHVESQKKRGSLANNQTGYESGRLTTLT